MKNIGILLLTLFLFHSCEAQKRKSKKQTTSTVQQKKAEIPMEKTYDLKEGENKFFPEWETNITFKSVKEDSRCPKGVQCIWEGVGVAEIELMGIYTRPQTFNLSTQNIPTKGYTNTIDFNNITLELKSLSPEPTKNQTNADLKGKYKIEFVVRKRN
ncbi:MAG: hypothetical protein JSS94_08940 [Bacteroidetes bacterium]|nr:hypothetical protein [Bacteroidota bacterium]